MANDNLGDKLVRALISLVTAVGTAFAAWGVIGQCPESMAKIDALKSTWFLAGYVCAKQSGWNVAPFFASIWLLITQFGLNFRTFSPTSLPTTRYKKATVLAITFFLLYLATFIL